MASLVINGFSIRVELVDGLISLHNLKAQSDYLAHVIRIDPSLVGPDRQAALVHELVHFVDYLYSLHLKEDQVTCLGFGLAQVWASQVEGGLGDAVRTTTPSRDERPATSRGKSRTSKGARARGEGVGKISSGD